MLRRKKKKKVDADTRESLLREHMLRGREGYNDLEWFMPFVVLGGKLHETERKALWKDVNGFINKVERNHFKQSHQKNKEYTEQRILLFYELCHWKWEYSMKYCCKMFICGFPNFECILMLRRWGVGGTRVEDYGTWQVSAIVTYLSLWRERKPYEQWYIDKNGRPPTAANLKMWEWRSLWVEHLIGEHLITQFIEGVRDEHEQLINMGNEDVYVDDGEDDL